MKRTREECKHDSQFYSASLNKCLICDALDEEELDPKVLLERVYKLENDLVTEMKTLLDQFYKETGLTPNRIEVNMMDATRCGNAHNEYIIINVMPIFDILGRM